MLMVPVAMAVGIVEGWNENKADRLVAKNRVLRLEAERAQLKSEREDALAARKRRKDGGEGLRPVPRV